MPNARETVADDEHDDRADDGEHDLRLHDDNFARALGSAPWAERQRRPEQRSQRQTNERDADFAQALEHR